MVSRGPSLPCWVYVALESRVSMPNRHLMNSDEMRRFDETRCTRSLLMRMHMKSRVMAEERKASPLARDHLSRVNHEPANHRHCNLGAHEPPGLATVSVSRHS